MKNSLLIYLAQICVIAVLGYIAWYLLNGRPNFSFISWFLVCLGAALVGLVPYLLIAAFKRKKRRDADQC